MKWLILLCALIPAIVSGQVWSDDFDDGDISDWTFTGDGSWASVFDTIVQYQNNVISNCLAQTSSSASESSGISNNCPAMGNYLITVRVRVLELEEAGTVAILGRVQSRNIQFGITKTGGLTQLFIYDANAGAVLATTNYTIELGAWYWLYCSLMDDVAMLRIYKQYNYPPIYSQLFATISGPPTGGTGMATTGGAVAHFDDFLAQEYPDCCDLAGDANNDHQYNIGDVIYLINYVFKHGPLPPCLNEGDANRDCNINVGDAVYLIKPIFKGGPRPECGCKE